MVKAFYITQGTQTTVHKFAFPGADLTQAFGVNDHGDLAPFTSARADNAGRQVRQRPVSPMPN